MREAIMGAGGTKAVTIRRSSGPTEEDLCQVFLSYRKGKAGTDSYISLTAQTAFTVVPLPGEDSTVSVPPVFSTLSLMPVSP